MSCSRRAMSPSPHGLPFLVAERSALRAISASLSASATRRSLGHSLIALAMIPSHPLRRANSASSSRSAMASRAALKAIKVGLPWHDWWRRGRAVADARPHRPCESAPPRFIVPLDGRLAGDPALHVLGTEEYRARQAARGRAPQPTLAVGRAHARGADAVLVAHVVDRDPRRQERRRCRIIHLDPSLFWAPRPTRRGAFPFSDRTSHRVAEPPSRSTRRRRPARAAVSHSLPRSPFPASLQGHPHAGVLVAGVAARHRLGRERHLAEAHQQSLRLGEVPAGLGHRLAKLREAPEPHVERRHLCHTYLQTSVQTSPCPPPRRPLAPGCLRRFPSRAERGSPRCRPHAPGEARARPPRRRARPPSRSPRAAAAPCARARWPHTRRTPRCRPARWRGACGRAAPRIPPRARASRRAAPPSDAGRAPAPPRSQPERLPHVVEGGSQQPRPAQQQPRARGHEQPEQLLAEQQDRCHDQQRHRRRARGLTRRHAHRYSSPAASPVATSRRRSQIPSARPVAMSATTAALSSVSSCLVATKSWNESWPARSAALPTFSAGEQASFFLTMGPSFCSKL
nr:MAG TPA: hypothetical protein [Caudoviricetes sp.]